MEINKKYIIETINEVLPKVKEISQLEFTLTNPNIILTNNILNSFIFSFMDLDPRNFLIYYYHMKGGFAPFENKFYFPKKSVQEDEFKETLAHEIMHFGQYSCFPFLREILTPDKQIFMDDESKAYNILLEGDACLIQERFKTKSKKIKIPTLAMKMIGNEHYKRFLQEKVGQVYTKGRKILKDKFKDNRGDINELYHAPAKDLIKIFEIN